MPRVVALANQKGGVGKTTTTLNVGAALVELGHEVLVVDLDPQAALTTSMGLSPADVEATIYNALLEPSRYPLANVTVPPPDAATPALVPASIDLAGAEVELINEIGRERVLADVLAQADVFDYVLIDCPPSLGLLTINALTAAHEVLIPVQCQYLALRGMQLLLATIQKVQARANPALRWRALPTFYDRRTAHAREVLEELRAVYGANLVDEPIPSRVGLADASVAGQSVLAYDPTSDVAEAYRRVAKELMHAAR